jgi:hypothetical protein
LGKRILARRENDVVVIFEVLRFEFGAYKKCIHPACDFVLITDIVK